MGMTLAEKILANKSGLNRVQPGEIVEVDVDVEASGVSAIEEGNEIEVNLESGEISDLITGKTYPGSQIPPFFSK